MAGSENRKLTWNPYIQIAKKIVQTHEERLADLDALDRDQKLIALGKPPLVSTRNLLAALPLSIDTHDGYDAPMRLYRDQIKVLIRIVEDAYAEAVGDLLDMDLRKEVQGKLKRYICEPAEVYEYIGYPLSRYDFDSRRRRLFRAVLRELWLMPYQHQPAEKGRRYKRDDQSDRGAVHGAASSEENTN